MSPGGGGPGPVLVERGPRTPRAPGPDPERAERTEGVGDSTPTGRTDESESVGGSTPTVQTEEFSYPGFLRTAPRGDEVPGPRAQKGTEGSPHRGLQGAVPGEEDPPTFLADEGGPAGPAHVRGVRQEGPPLEMGWETEDLPTRGTWSLGPGRTSGTRGGPYGTPEFPPGVWRGSPPLREWEGGASSLPEVPGTPGWWSEDLGSWRRGMTPPGEGAGWVDPRWGGPLWWTDPLEWVEFGPPGRVGGRVGGQDPRVGTGLGRSTLGLRGLRDQKALERGALEDFPRVGGQRPRVRRGLGPTPLEVSESQRALERGVLEDFVRSLDWRLDFASARRGGPRNRCPSGPIQAAALNRRAG